MGKFRGMDTEEGWIQRRLAKIERDLAEQSAARRLVVASAQVQADNNNLDLATTFTTYLTQTIQVPKGYQYAIVQMSVNVGTTFSGTGNGNVGCQCVVAGFGGPSMSSGKNGGGALSVSTSMSIKIAVSGSFQLWASAYNNGDPRNSLSGNVHLSATVIFTRD